MRCLLDSIGYPQNCSDVGYDNQVWRYIDGDIDVGNDTSLAISQFVWKNKIETENALIWSHLEPQLVVKGRCIFLKKLLERQQLYYVKTEWENQARDNIARDIKESIQ